MIIKSFVKPTITTHENANYAMGQNDSEKKKFIELIMCSSRPQLLKLNDENQKEIVGDFKGEQYKIEAFKKSNLKELSEEEVDRLNKLGLTIIASLHPGESLTPNQWLEACRHIEKKIGVKIQIEVCTTHKNTDSDHAHWVMLISRTSNFKNTKLKRNKLSKIEAELEQLFGLLTKEKGAYKGTNEFYVKDKYNIKSLFRTIIDEAINSSKSKEDFFSKLPEVSRTHVKNFKDNLYIDHELPTLRRIGNDAFELEFRFRLDKNGNLIGISYGLGNFAAAGFRLGQLYTLSRTLKRIQEVIDSLEDIAKEKFSQVERKELVQDEKQKAKKNEIGQKDKSLQEPQSKEDEQRKDSITNPGKLYTRLAVLQPTGETYGKYLDETVDALWATILVPTRTNREKARTDESQQLPVQREECNDLLFHNLQHLFWLNFLEQEEKKLAQQQQKEENELSLQKESEEKREEKVKDSAHEIRKAIYISHFTFSGGTPPDKKTEKALELLATGNKKGLVSYLIDLLDREKEGPSILINELFEPEFEIQQLVTQLNEGMITRRTQLTTHFESIVNRAPDTKEWEKINSIASGETPQQAIFILELLALAVDGNWQGMRQLLEAHRSEVTLSGDDLTELLSIKKIPDFVSELLTAQLDESLLTNMRELMTHFKSKVHRTPNSEELTLIIPIASGYAHQEKIFNVELLGLVRDGKWQDIDQLLQAHGSEVPLSGDDLKELLLINEIPLTTTQKLKKVAKTTWFHMADAPEKLENDEGYDIAVENHAQRIGVNSFDKVTHFQTAREPNKETPREIRRRLKDLTDPSFPNNLEIVDDNNLLNDNGIDIGEVFVCVIRRDEIGTDHFKEYLFIEEDAPSLKTKIESYFLMKELNLVDYSLLKKEPLEEFLLREYNISNIQLKSEDGSTQIWQKNNGIKVIINLKELDPSVQQAITRYIGRNIEPPDWSQEITQKKGLSR